MGIPFMTAPSEAEAQCAELTRRGVADVAITTDTDALFFGATKVVINLSESLRGEPVEELELDKCLKGEAGNTEQFIH